MKYRTPFPSRLASDPLRAAIATILLAPACALADGITPQPGAGGTPIVEQHGPTDLINIVAPVSGTSYNQYLDYNVGTGGAVINNATSAGQSELLGQLGANPQFNGASANMIINEVVGSNTSNVNGPQEIFGQAADYVLANPNGIHVNGGRLINAPQSAFLVGTPEVADGRLTGLNTTGANGQLLIDGAGLSSDGALRLIAPRVDAFGKMQTSGELAVIAGRNRVDGYTGQVLETQQGDGQAFDAQLLGAMSAGRIRVLSTREGAGVRMASADFIASQGMDVSSAGSLNIGDAATPTRLVSTAGDVDLQARDDLNLTYTRVGGRNINGLAGGDINVAPGRHDSQRDEKPEQWSSHFLGIETESYDKRKHIEKSEVLESVLTAQQELKLQAGRNLKLTATDIQAQGDISLAAAGDVTLDAATEQTRTTTTTRHRKHLWSSQSESEEVRERAAGTQLQGRNIQLSSGGTTTVRGSQINSQGDTRIEAKALVVESHALKGSDRYDERSGDHLGGLVDKGSASSDVRRQQQAGSGVLAGGKLTVAAGEVHLKGSTVYGTTGAELISQAGAISLQSSENATYTNKEHRTGAVFGLVSSSEKSSQEKLTSEQTQVGSGSNLVVASKTDANIDGAKVNATGELMISAEGDINITAGRDTETQHEEKTERHFVATAGETQVEEDNKSGSRQYNAQVGLVQADTNTAITDEKVVRAELTGSNVSLNAGGKARIDSADVSATGGNLLIEAQAVDLASSSDRHSESTQATTTGGGIGATGGMDRSGTYSWGERISEKTTASQDTAQVTQLNASGDVSIIAGHGKGHMDNSGAQARAGGTVNVVAGSVDNHAVADTEERHSERTEYKGTAGINIETRFITRPIEKLITGQDQTIFQKGVEEALDAPSLGIDLVGTHTRREASQSSSTAKVSTFEGNNVQVQVEGELNDQGTRYKAGKGTVDIRAASHDMTAAQNTQSSQVKRTDVEGSGRLDTITSVDVNGRLMASGSGYEQNKASTEAVASLIDGKQGISVQLGTDGRYEGTRFNSGLGALDLQTGGSLRMDQANNTQTETTTSTDGFGWVRLGTAPGKARDLGAGGALNHERKVSEASQGIGVTLDGHKVDIAAGGDFISQGLAAGSKAKPLEALNIKAQGTAQLLAAVDTSSVEGQRLGSGLQLSGLMAPASTGAGLGGHVDIGRTQERVREEKTSQVFAQQLAVRANDSSADAVRLQGVQVQGKEVDLQASNGGILIDSATRTETRDNVAVTAGLGANTLKTGDIATDASGLHARLRVKVDNLDSTTHTNASITTGTLNLNSADDTRLEGAVVKANTVGGQVGGDLTVATRQDRVKGTEVNIDGRISQEHNPQGLVNALGALAGPFAGKVKEQAGNIRKADPNTSPGLSLDIVRTDRTTAAQQSLLSGRDGISLEVGGTTHVNGALIKSSQGQVDLGGGPVELNDLKGRDYRADVSLNASNSPSELISGVLNESLADKGQQAQDDQHINAGFYRSGGHDQEQTLEGRIEQKRL